jgi:hypothetical protein
MSALTLHDPSGLDIDSRLDVSIREALDRLFPDGPGKAIFYRLRSLAESTSESVGQLAVKGLQELASLLKHSYETTTKYVAVFCACHLIERNRPRHDKRLFLSFPRIYQPPASLLSDLEKLLARPAARPKVKSLVRQVRDRALAYSYSNVQALGGDLAEQLRQVKQVLSTPQVDSDTRIARAMAMLSQLIANCTKTSARVVDSDVEDYPTREVDSAMLRHDRQDISPLQVDSRVPALVTASQPRAESTALVDSNLPPVQNLPVKSISAVDSGWRSTVGPSVLSTSVVDSGRKPEAVAALLSTLPVDSAKRRRIESTSVVDSALVDSAKVVDSVSQTVDSGESFNVNVYTYITSNINVNVKGVAALICKLMGEKVHPGPGSKFGFYYQLFKDKGCDNPEAIYAAFIFVQYHHHHDGTIKMPGKVFHARCQEYHRLGIPEEAQALVTAYRHLTHAEFRAEMAKPESTSPGLPRITPAAESTPARRPAPKPKLEITIALRGAGGMERKEAQRLKEMLREDRSYGAWKCETRIVQLAGDSSYALVVAGLNQHQVAIYSAAQWERNGEDLVAELMASRVKSLSELRAGQGQGREGEVALATNGGMSWGEANSLVQFIRKEDSSREAERLSLSKLQIVQLADTSYALLIDASSRRHGQRMTALYASEEWHEQKAEIVTGLLGRDRDRTKLFL